MEPLTLEPSTGGRSSLAADAFGWVCGVRSCSERLRREEWENGVCCVPSFFKTFCCDGEKRNWTVAGVGAEVWGGCSVVLCCVVTGETTAGMIQ